MVILNSVTICLSIKKDCSTLFSQCHLSDRVVLLIEQYSQHQTILRAYLTAVDNKFNENIPRLSILFFRSKEQNGM